jgi:hypothetical protein
MEWQPPKLHIYVNMTSIFEIRAVQLTNLTWSNKFRFLGRFPCPSPDLHCRLQFSKLGSANFTSRQIIARYYFTSRTTVRYKMLPSIKFDVDFNLRTGILITGCMACRGGSSTHLLEIMFIGFSSKIVNFLVLDDSSCVRFSVPPLLLRYFMLPLWCFSFQISVTFDSLGIIHNGIYPGALRVHDWYWQSYKRQSYFWTCVSF